MEHDGREAEQDAEFRRGLHLVLELPPAQMARAVLKIVGTLEDLAANVEADAKMRQKMESLDCVRRAAEWAEVPEGETLKGVDCQRLKSRAEEFKTAFADRVEDMALPTTGIQVSSSIANDVAGLAEAPGWEFVAVSENRHSMFTSRMSSTVEHRDVSSLGEQTTTAKA